MPGPRSVTFETTVQQTGNNTGIVVPPEKMSALGAGGRPQVLVEVNGYQYRSAVGMMGGEHMVSVSAAVRKATGLKGDDDVRVTLTVAESPREVEIPDDLQTAFEVNGAARAFFATLSNSLQRYHIDNINAAKTAETRQRRIEQSIGLFLAGKKRWEPTPTRAATRLFVAKHRLEALDTVREVLQAAFCVDVQTIEYEHCVLVGAL
jgi:hypothetical protein